MAPGRGRLGPFLNTGDTILQLLEVLDRTPAPHGGERAAAAALAAWCSARWPRIEWTVQPYGGTGANLCAAPRDPPAAGGLLIYSHLDTSLSGDPERDRPITGRADAPGPLTVTGDGRLAEGFALGVARAPAAAAVAGFAEAAPHAGVRLLLAGSGTHRGVLTGAGTAVRATGLDAFLSTGPRPDAAVVAKSGPPTLLWEEPGALYLRVRVRGRYGAVLSRRSAVPPGGVIACAGIVTEAIERWRTGYVSPALTGLQVGRAAGIGSLTAGRPDKPDLFPAQLEAGVYVVTVPGDDPAAIAGDLVRTVRAACAPSPLRDCVTEVDVDAVHPAAATSADAPIVRAARETWIAEFGEAPPPISGWTGSTDGVVLRGRGIDTVRAGPASRPSDADPRRDVVELDALAAYARFYAALAVRHGRR